MPTPAPGQPPLYTGMMDCVRQTIKSEGLGAFYKGTVPPLLGVGLCVAIQFAAVEQAKSFFTTRNADGSVVPLTWSQHYMSGAFAGVANSVVSGPVEHLRTRLQVQRAGEAAFKGPMDALSQIYKRNGIAGIFKGQVATILRYVCCPSRLCRAADALPQ